MTKVTLLGIKDTVNRMDRIKFLSIETGLSLIESRNLFDTLDGYKFNEKFLVDNWIEVDFIGERDQVLNKLDQQGFYYKLEASDVDFDRDKSIAKMKKNIIPYLEHYQLQGSTLVDTRTGTVWIICNPAEAKFMEEYLISKGITIDP